jgi:hypothetical protein
LALDEFRTVNDTYENTREIYFHRWLRMDGLHGIDGVQYEQTISEILSESIDNGQQD